MRSFVLTIFLTLTGIAQAQSIVTVTCQPPKGSRISYGIPPEDWLVQRDDSQSRFELETGETSFTGVNPIFLLDGENPQEMIVIWGDTKVEGVPEELIRSDAKKLPIVHLSENQITAVESYSNGVWVHSLYPKLGFGVFTRQTHYTGVEHAIGAVFYSKCRFSGLVTSERGDTVQPRE